MIDPHCNQSTWSGLFPKQNGTRAQLLETVRKIHQVINNTNGITYPPPTSSSGNLTAVKVHLNISKVNSVMINENALHLDADLTQIWFDARFKLNVEVNTTLRLVGDDAKRIWTPSTYYADAYQGSASESFESTHTYAVVSTTGNVALKSKAIVALQCRLGIQRDPYDNHRCFVRLKAERQIHEPEFTLHACVLKDSFVVQNHMVYDEVSI